MAAGPRVGELITCCVEEGGGERLSTARLLRRQRSFAPRLLPRLLRRQRCIQASAAQRAPCAASPASRRRALAPAAKTEGQQPLPWAGRPLRSPQQRKGRSSWVLGRRRGCARDDQESRPRPLRMEVVPVFSVVARRSSAWWRGGPCLRPCLPCMLGGLVCCYRRGAKLTPALRLQRPRPAREEQYSDSLVNLRAQRRCRRARGCPRGRASRLGAGAGRRRRRSRSRSPSPQPTERELYKPTPERKRCRCGASSLHSCPAALR